MLSALRSGRRFTPQKYYGYSSGNHFCETLGKPQGLVRLEGLDVVGNVIYTIAAEHIIRVYHKYLTPKSRSKLSYDKRSIGQSVLVSGHYRGPANNFSFSYSETLFRCLRYT
jgi:hypothetical protein